MKFLRTGSLFALVGLSSLIAGGGACTVTTNHTGGPGAGTVALGDACTSDLDCLSGDFCDLNGTGLCTTEGTVAVGSACSDDRDCDPGDFCDGHTGLCVAAGTTDIAIGAACEYDAECLPGDACDDTGTCVADPYASGAEDTGAACYEDADCSSDYCDQDTDTCV